MSSLNTSKKQQSGFSSLGFLITATAASVGLSNIWRFAPQAAKNGGGIYVLCYILSVAFVGFPIILAELTLGRSKKAGLHGAYQGYGYWQWSAGFAVITCFIIFCFYNVVAGWVLGYFWNLLNGELFEHTSITQFQAFFDSVKGNCSGNLLWTLIMVVAAILINQAGISNGIEKCAKVLMPFFVVMIAGLVIYAFSLKGPGKWDGLRYYLWPRLANFGFASLAAALSQAIMSLGVGVGLLVTYGSYVNKKDSLYKASAVIATGDTLVALLAGIFIFAFLGDAKVDFTTGSSSIEGTGLAFVALPFQFHDAGIVGKIVLGSFFLLLLFAAITSSIGLLEAPTKYVENRFGTPRTQAIWMIALSSYAVSIVCIAANAKSAYLPVFMHNFYQNLEDVAINILAPFSGFLFSLFIAYKWKIAKVFEEANFGNQKQRNKYFMYYIAFSIKYICPLLTGFCCVYSIKLFT